MIAVCLPVNASSVETPGIGRAPNRNELKNSAIDNKKDLSQLVDFLLKNGNEFVFKEHIAPALGLPGPMPSKMAIVSKEEHPAENGFDSVARLCFLVYSNSPDGDGKDSKRPLCVYLRKHVVSGYNDDDRYFRINLDGQLEKVVIIRAKRDAEGKAVRGSGVFADQDIKSSESKKEFTAEMTEMKKWLKVQRLLAKSNASPASAAPAAAP